MTVRIRLLLAQAPTVLAVIFVGVIASITNATLGHNSELILKDNFRSVLAAQRMKEAIERIDSAALFIVSGEEARGASQAAENQPRFSQELAAQEHNVTEPGEAEATHLLRAHWTDYQGRFAAFSRIEGPDARKRAYFADLEPVFRSIKQSADVILGINQDAMVRKSEHARRTAKRLDALMIAAAMMAVCLGLFLSTALTARVLRPLSVLRQAARRLGEGDLSARARVWGQDEIAEVAREFNTMANRLAQYRASSLGELLQAQQQTQAAIDSLPDPVLVFDLTGALLAVNRATEDILGIRPAADVHTALSSAPPELRVVIERVQAHVASGRGSFQPKGLEEALRVPSSSQDLCFLPRGSPVRTESGVLMGVAILLQDVTRLMRFDELKTNLVATVAHEFRTPLTSLRMALHLCLEQAVGPLTEKQSDLLFAARQDTERLQQIVDDLLDLSRIQDGQIELRRRSVDPGTLAREAIAPLRGSAEDKQINLRVDILPGLSEVFVDPDRMELVFANLMGNAIKYTPAGGTVSVSAQPAGDMVRFSVDDSGPGIPPSLRQTVFEKFFRLPGTSAPGAGLGLFIAKQIVDAHGGRIGVHSSASGGCHFWFDLPTAASEALHPPAEGQDSKAPEAHS